MEHFYNNIHGWADGIDALYQQMVKSVPNGEMVFTGEGFAPSSTRQYHFVEIGTWKGKSAACMAVEIINSGKDIKFDCVDTWQGSDEEDHQEDEYVVSNSLYEHFVENMKPVEGYYNPVRMTSLAAAELYEDGSLDFVFIDASHDYENVKADIAAWAPKVRPGGYLAGHDFNPATPNNDVERAVLEAFPDVTPLPWCWGKQM
jgi:cephalosporin hydroxylase